MNVPVPGGGTSNRKKRENDNDEMEPLTPRDSADSSENLQSNWMSFDDQGHAANYLQFFKSPVFQKGISKSKSTPYSKLPSPIDEGSRQTSSEVDNDEDDEDSYSDDETSEMSYAAYEYPLHRYTSEKSLYDDENVRLSKSSYETSDSSRASFSDSTLSGLLSSDEESNLYYHGRLSTGAYLNGVESSSHLYGESISVNTATSGSLRGLKVITDSAKDIWYKMSSQVRTDYLSSERSELNDLNYLLNVHQTKISQYDLNDQDFDFCLILCPQQVYGFWAELLDFRVELLGPDVVKQMEEQWNLTTSSSSSTSKSSGSSASSLSMTPNSIRRRPNATTPHARSTPSLYARTPIKSPSVYSVMPTTCKKSSVFERAMDTPNPHVIETPITTRRRWGYQRGLSPPVKSLEATRETKQSEAQTAPKNKLPPSDQDPELPNPVIPRGIAARTNRTNGMLPFLSALKRGIVVRKHTPGQEASYCRLYSSDGGDSIQYSNIEKAEAMMIFKEQKVRYNKDPLVETASWSQSSNSRNCSVPDYVAADKYRKKMRKLTAKLGTIKIADVIAVHPARNKDPRNNGDYGTSSLRRSKSDYNKSWTFSLVLGRRNKNGDLETKWKLNEGNETQFRYLNFEAATPGEYWLIFRGLLWLHRDALVGRFAIHRAAGIGTFAKPENLQIHQDEFHEPATVGFLEKFIVNCRNLDTTYMEGFVTKDGAIPPPSDYFLGFRSPGTAIWSRLRQAGLETHRVYSLDPNRVMIKIRCPSDRLMDVAEVLRIKLRTKDGGFAPFREDMIDIFDNLDDPLEKPQSMFGFRSSLRQTIIDFIIGSRIRDSGAELDPSSDLGQKIQARVPLHMHGKLNEIFQQWFYFWKVENWNNTRKQQSEKLSIDSGDDDSDESSQIQVYNLFTRIFMGCMHQPLDSIEQYFGEKVAFYFTWLQHTSAHLVFLSIPGLFMFTLQVASNNFDHVLRPVFAIIVMLWTFIVLANWKKRANLMAHRWGTMNYKEQETTRPQFKGEYTQDEITGEWIVRYPKWKRWLKYCISFPLTLFFTGGTLILILWVHANRDLQLANYLQTQSNSTEFHFDFAFDAIGKKAPIVEMELTRENLMNIKFWFIVVGMPSILGLFLPLLNFILMRLSVMLNDFENYRTESEYRTYLIIKVFSFRFVCYFATLYYYSFVSTGDDKAIQNGILRVGTGVLVYTTVAQWWQNVLHLCFPMLIRKLRMNHRNQRLTDELRAIELEEERISQLSPHQIDSVQRELQVQLINKRLLLEQAQDPLWLELMNPPHDSFPEYIQAVVQFTFVSCFSVVLPITPVIVLFNYLVSMRLDAYKLCKGRRRPLAEKTGGIGVWEHVLHIVAVISVLTNCWLIGFTSSQFIWIAGKIGDLGMFALIVGWEHVMLLIKYIMSTSMSTLPKSVRDAMKREQYELDKQRNHLMLERRRQQQPLEERKSRITEV